MQKGQMVWSEQPEGCITAKKESHGLAEFGMSFKANDLSKDLSGDFTDLNCRLELLLWACPQQS